MKTKITGSSKSNRCLIRKKQVADTPEERVRQTLLRKMVAELGYPKGLISVERGVGCRRADIVCYTKEMSPLLLIECKAGPLNDAAIRQALGYNGKIKAPFVAIANANEAITFWFEGEKSVSVPFLPVFKELYEVSQRF